MVNHRRRRERECYVMIPAMMVGKILPKLVKLLTKQFKGLDKIEKLLKYVEEPNELDDAVQEMQLRMNRLEKQCQDLEEKVKSD